MSMLPTKPHSGGTAAILRRLILSLGGLLAMSGCHLTPRYVRPQVTTAPAYKELEKDTGVVWQPAQPSDSAIRPPWWELFKDDELNTLEGQVDVSNQNIAIAAANYAAAVSIVRENRAQLFPSGSIGASFSNTRISANPAFHQLTGTGYTEYSLPVEASWEPDLWGKVRSSVRSGRFQAQADAATLESVRLAEHAQVALDYYLVRTQDSLAEVLDRTIRTDQDTFDLTQSLNSAGLTSDEALAAAEAQLHSAKTQRDAVAIVRAQYLHALAVLLARPAEDFSLAGRSLSGSAPEVPVGVPAQLLERRPDIAAAERNVAAANVQIGIARAAYFPILTLSGTAGFTSLTAADWLTWPSRAWAAGPSLVETVFDAGLRRATAQEYRSRYDAAVAAYRQTSLTAFQQVEDNLAALRILRYELEEQEAAVANAQRAFEESTTRYRSGLDPYLNVVESERTLLLYRQTLVSLRSQQLVATVQLIQSLGGGWNEHLLPGANRIP